MNNYNISIFFLFFLFPIFYSKINYGKLILPLHPLKIKIIYTEIQTIPNYEAVHSTFEEIKTFFSSLLLTSFNRSSFNFTESNFTECGLPITNYSNNNLDILIIPIIYNKQKTVFSYQTCEKGKKDFISLVKIKINIHQLYYIKDYDILKNNILTLFLRILGFDYLKLLNHKIQNNFMELPDSIKKISSKFSLQKFYYIMNKTYYNSYYSNTIKKSYYFLNNWPDYYEIDDIISNNSEIYSPMTELTLNIFNEFPDYVVSLCDVEYINEIICVRIDQKCLHNKLLANYYISFEIYKNKTICYLDNKFNIINKQCGNIFGNIIKLNDVNFSFTKNYINDHHFKINQILKNYTILKYNNTLNKKSRLIQYNRDHIKFFYEQKIYLLSTDKKCDKSQPRTILFRNKYFNNEKLNEWLKKNDRNIEEIILKEKNFYMTFKQLEKDYIPQVLSDSLKNNNFIQIFELNDWNQNLLLNFGYPKELSDLPKKNFNSHYLKICGFMNCDLFGYKDKFYKLYETMQKKFPNDFNFHTKTYFYPRDKKIINETILNNSNFDPENLWLFKPPRGSLGIGIEFFKNFNQTDFKYYLINKYVSFPHLIYEKKYDLRIYVLISSIAPLKIYLYHEGLVRFATENYNLNEKDLNNRYIHLTNVYINKLNRKKYHKSEDKNSEKYSKWNFETYFKYIVNLYGNEIKQMIIVQIKDIIIKSILCVQHKIYDFIKKSKHEVGNFFHLLGFDIILDKNFNAYLIEINTFPSMDLNDEVDKSVKYNLIADMLNIVGIVPFNKIHKEKTYDNSSKIYKKKIINAVHETFCEFYRPIGDFERIFPKIDNINQYKKFFIKNNEYNSMLWKKMLNDENKTESDNN